MSLLCFMLFRPPRATRFPYTTLFRSNQRRVRDQAITQGDIRRISKPNAINTLIIEYASIDHETDRVPHVQCVRSEEHTSELQSLRHLVCRLLLEKKKKNQYTTIQHAN